MKTTIEIDEELLRTAQKYFPRTDLNALLNEALKDLIHMQASRRLAKAGGAMPDLKPIRRTRGNKL
jgi:Arc/MetJ family transcription regulator